MAVLVLLVIEQITMSRIGTMGMTTLPKEKIWYKKHFDVKIGYMPMLRGTAVMYNNCTGNQCGASVLEHAKE